MVRLDPKPGELWLLTLGMLLADQDQRGPRGRAAAAETAQQGRRRVRRDPPDNEVYLRYAGLDPILTFRIS
jgi:hypothetical protein